jgi:2-furoyl-CoA dehydrogenase 2Fe-2S iron sulfur subunit
VAKSLKVRVTVNGVLHEHTVEARMLLADFLRHDLHLSGTHIGCAHGVCGACTVLIDGISARSCLTFAAQVDGASVTTVEGLARDDTLSPIQQCFHEQHALQCGYCTPGLLIVITELLARDVDPATLDLREELAGNLCRCTGYHNILQAAESALQRAASSRSAGVEVSGAARGPGSRREPDPL